MPRKRCRDRLTPAAALAFPIITRAVPADTGGLPALTGARRA